MCTINNEHYRKLERRAKLQNAAKVISMGLSFLILCGSLVLYILDPL